MQRSNGYAIRLALQDQATAMDSEAKVPRALAANMCCKLTSVSPLLKGPVFNSRPGWPTKAMWHLLEDARALRLNSRFTHCFIDEDHVGWCKKLWSRARASQQERQVVRLASLRLRTIKWRAKQLNAQVRSRLLKATRKSG